MRSLEKALLDPQGQDHLLELALVGQLVAHEEVLGDLLRDGGGPLGPPIAVQTLEVAERRPGDPDNVDPRMVVEILVLGRDERLLDPIGDGLGRDEDPVLPRILGQQAAIAGMDAGGGRRLVGRQLPMVGQVAIIVLDQVEQARAGHHQEHDGPQDQGRE